MGNNDTGILQRSVRSVEPVCFATSHEALFHMKPRGCLTATGLTEAKTLPEGSETLKFNLSETEEAYCLPSGSNLSVIKMILKRIFLYFINFSYIFIAGTCDTEIPATRSEKASEDSLPCGGKLIRTISAVLGII